MIGTHAWTYIGDAVSMFVIVGAFCVAMLVAERR